MARRLPRLALRILNINSQDKKKIQAQGSIITMRAIMTHSWGDLLPRTGSFQVFQILKTLIGMRMLETIR